MFELLMVVAGFVPLIFGANWLVNGASVLAKKSGIPSLVIGLTVVSFGTSAPELIINIFAALNHTGSMVLGNLTGANSLNLMVILGLSAVLTPVVLKKSSIQTELPLAILAALVILVLANDGFIAGAPVAEINRVEGIALLGFFLIYLVYTFRLAQNSRYTETLKVQPYGTTQAIFWFVAGMTALAVGGKLVADYAAAFAFNLGIPERVVGFTIVAFGTSLPELVTAIVAGLKKNTDLSIGNLIGSTIFNTFFVLGISAIISPVPLAFGANLDLLVNLGAAALLFLFVFTGKGRQLDRWEGLTLMGGWVAYVVYLVLRLPTFG